MDSSDTKPWWQSKTILAILAMVIITTLKHFNIEASDSDSADIMQALSEILTGLFGGIAIYGRMTAKQKIG